MAALKSLSDYSNICVILMLASVFVFSHMSGSFSGSFLIMPINFGLYPGYFEYLMRLWSHLILLRVLILMF